LNILASGTVGAALRARQDGYNSIAFSLDHHSSYISGEPASPENWNFGLAATLAQPIVEEVLAHSPLEAVLLNVNFPSAKTKEEIRGYKQTRQGYSDWDNQYKEVAQPDGFRAFRMYGAPNCKDTDTDCDTLAIRSGWVSITPLGIHLDPLQIDKYIGSLNKLAKWKIFQIYPFPNPEITPEYFQWLRDIGEPTLKSHIGQGTKEQIDEFLEYRAQHILEHIDGTVIVHTARLPNGTEADEADPGHWVVDWRFFLRLRKLFPEGQILSDLSKATAIIEPHLTNPKFQ